MKRENRTIYMMLTFFMIVMTVFCNKTATSNALETRTTSGWASAGTATRYITEDTVLTLDQDLSVRGIIIDSGCTLIIKGEGTGKTLYTCGNKEKRSDNVWIQHAGIEVPYNSRLIIDIGDSNKIIAVGAAANSKDDNARGTGAGIGGYGIECDSFTETTDNSCGMVIIKSGKVIACGGCSLGGKDGEG